MNDEKSDKLLQLVSMAGLLTIGILYAASFFPEARVWGFSWFGHFSWYGPAVLLLAGLGFSFVNRLEVESGRDTTSERQVEERSYLMIVLSLLLLFGIAFCLARGRTHFLGDGYLVLAKAQAGAEALKPWDLATWLIQSSLFNWLGVLNEAGARLILQWLSVACGVTLLAALSAGASYLFDNVRDRLLFVIGMASGGYMLLFFGYIENYPLFVLMVGIFSLAGLMIASEKLHRAWIVIPLIGATLFHPFGLALVPPAAYLLLRGSSTGRRFAQASSGTRFAIIVFPLIVCFLVFYYLYTHVYFFRFAFVPFWRDRFTVERYTLFSLPHLLDMVNLLFSLIPGLLVLVAATVKLPWRDVLRRPEYRFLLLLVFMSLGVLFVINPRLGMPRDWDLFAFCALPLMSFFLYALLDRRNAIPGRTIVCLAAIGLGFLVLIPRVAIQVVPEKSIALLDTYTELDVIKSRNARFLLQEYLERRGEMDEYDRRALISGAALPHGHWSRQGMAMGLAGDLAGALDKFHQSIRFDPSFPYAWGNLGVLHVWSGQYDSALTYLAVADGLNPYCFATYMQTAAAYSGLTDYPKAEEYWLKAARLEPEDFESRGYLLDLYQRVGRQHDYETLLMKTVIRARAPLNIVGQAAYLELLRGDFEAASIWYGRAVELGLDSAEVFELQEKYELLDVL